MSIRPRPLVLALLAVLALAGCVSYTGGQTTSRPVVDSPPGVENSTLENTTALLDAHIETVTAIGFIVRESTNASHREDGKLVRQNRSMRYAAEPELGSFRVVPGGDGTELPAVWANETVVLAREDRSDETIYHRPPRTWTPPAMLTGAQDLAQHFELGTYSRTETTECDETACAVLEANGSSSDGVQNLTGTVLVDSRGVVHEARIEYDRVTNDRTYRTRYRFDLLRTGNVSVERPEWVGEAIERT